MTSIGEDAFYKCSKLTSVTIGNSVTSIGEDAFYGCTGLKKVIVTDITAWLRIEFGTSANPLIYAQHLFSDEDTEITNLIIPNSVTSIGNNAFSYCTGLTSVTIGNSVTSIGNNAFSYCTGLTSVTIPNSVTSIGEYAFSYCTGLTSVTIPNSVTSIGEYAFGGCYFEKNDFINNSSLDAEAKKYWGATIVDSRKDGLVIKDGTLLKYIGKDAFVTIPNSVTSIGSRAFYECSGLTSVTIPNSVTSIGKDAFSWCTSLTSVTIPNSVTSIGSSAFGYCKRLTSVTIPNSVTSIGWYAFSGCSKLTSVTIPNSVTRIELGAFRYCSGLTSVTIPNSVTSIGNWAFQSCSKLTSVTIPNSVTSIAGEAFDDCSSLKSVKSDILVPFTFASNAFRNISSNCVLAVPYGTKDAYIAKGWTTSVFKGGIKEMTYVVDGIYYGFNSNNKQATVTASENKYSGNVIIPSSVTYNGETYSVTSIGEDAFFDCSGLTSITIPNSVTSIGNSAFGYCSGLSSVTIPNNVTNIGSFAFYCENLATVVSLIENPFDIDSYVFSKYPRMNATLYVPIGTMDEYKATGGWKDFKNIVEGTPTGITSVTSDKETTNAPIYDLNGRRLTEPAKGINIIGGKKVLNY